MIDFSLSETQKKLKEEIVTFTTSELNHAVEERDRLGVFDRSLWKKCAEIGLAGCLAGTSSGGRGFNAIDTTIALESLGYGSEDGGLNFSMAAHILAGLAPLQFFGTDAQHQQYLPKIISGDMIIANAMTEDSSGSDPFAMATTFRKEGSGYILDGLKDYCSNGPVADLILVYAREEGSEGIAGLTCFMVPGDMAGVEKGDPVHKLGLRTCPMGNIEFDQVSLVKDNILGGQGGGALVFHKTMIWERACLSAIHLGTLKRLLRRAVDFANSRQSAGSAIGSYQAVSHSLAKIKMDLEVARSILFRAAWALDQKKEAMLLASISKTFISNVYQEAMLSLKQIYAGAAIKGYHEIERNIRDSLCASIYSGTTEIQFNIICRQLGL